MDKTIPSSKRQALLKALPCFSTLTSDQVKALASLFSVVRYKPNELIVSENTLVDSVFIIVKGEAEVTQLLPMRRRLRKKPRMVAFPIATLSRGEAIGLNDTGFFSTTGMRTATVTAETAITALRLDLTKLHLFFEQYPELNAAMHGSTETMLRWHLIKESLPFSQLRRERLEELANQVEKIHVSAGSIILRQGEEGDRSYLIQSGEVEVLAEEPGFEAHRLATLKSSMLFGEATLITQEVRNATVRALTDCDLFVLKHEYLLELMESETEVSDMLMTLMVDRSRPKRNSSIRVYPRRTASGQEIIILKNPVNGRYFKLSKTGWFIWRQLNGKKTMHEITFALADKFNRFEPDHVAALILKLDKGGFIESLRVSEERCSNKPLWVRVMVHAKRILEARITIKNGDKWIDKIYKKIGYLIFTPLGKTLLSVIAVSGFISFITFTPQVIQLFKTLPDSEWLFFLVLPLMVFSVALHELGHAITTKSFGYEVKHVGIGWYWLGPVAFTDTSDMWLAQRWSRVAVNIAGVLADLVTAGACALVIWAKPNGYLPCLLWVFALYTYIGAFRMLSPLQELDGYYILMDLFDRPRLRYSSVVWLTKGLPSALHNPRLFGKSKAEMSYWVACILYLIAIVFVTFWLQAFIFKILDFPVHNIFVSLILPICMMVISSVGILADIRNQKS